LGNYTEVVDRWVDIVMGRTTKANLSNPRLFGSGDSMFSYGSHFELGRVLRDRKGQPRTFLLNGDRFSVTTARHQQHIRNGVRNQGVPTVIIPFSALDAAGINLDSVELIEETGDRTETTTHTTYEKPSRAVWDEEPIKEYGCELTADELTALLAKKNAKNIKEWESHKRWADEELAGGVEDGFWTRWLTNNPAPEVTTFDDLNHWEQTIDRVIGTKKILRAAPKSWRRIDFEELPDGRTRYTWTTTRHWLGESLIKAKVQTRGRTTCKACKGTGHTAPVNRAEMASLSFSERMDISDRHRCPACNGRGGKAWTRNRTAFFLSGFDHNEPRPVYFFCELPKGVNPTTVAEAYEDLKPEPVRLAEQMGRTIHRQGDIFAIELLGLTKRELRSKGARFEKRGNLLNTNHEATEVAYLPDGTTLVRGTLWHNPEWRDPDHVRVTVGKSWHIAIKNTVPVAA
jgi:hypothetical protein